MGGPIFEEQTEAREWAFVPLEVVEISCLSRQSNYESM